MSIITVCALVARRRGRCALAPSPSGRSRGQFKTRMVFATINKSAARTSAKVICPRGLVEQQASSPFDLSHRGALLQANGQAPVSAAEPKLRPRTTRTSTRASRAWDVAAYSTVQFYPSQLALAMPGPPRVTRSAPLLLLENTGGCNLIMGLALHASQPLITSKEIGALPSGNLIPANGRTVKFL